MFLEVFVVIGGIGLDFVEMFVIFFFYVLCKGKKKIKIYK